MRLKMYMENGDPFKDTYVETLREAREHAQKFLSAHKRGAVYLTDSQHVSPLRIYFRDHFTGAFAMTNDRTQYIIGYNSYFPWSRAEKITDARMKACKILRERGGFICIFKAVKGMAGLEDVAVIMTNGSRFEYSEGNRRFTLNPSTGRLGKY
ncbi:MAG: hypothetical protein IIY21_06470 [Clostridiales bacterium]|nr:hypothetical protein [Clostridiales bacterium]